MPSVGPANLLAFAHENLMQVRVERVQVDPASSIPIGMADNDRLAPTHAGVARINHKAVRRAVNRCPQIRVASAIAVPIVAHVATGDESARPVVALRIRLAHRHVETVRTTGHRILHPFLRGHRRPCHHAQKQEAGESESGKHGRSIGLKSPAGPGKRSEPSSSPAQGFRSCICKLPTCQQKRCSKARARRRL